MVYNRLTPKKGIGHGSSNRDPEKHSQNTTVAIVLGVILV